MKKPVLALALAVLLALPLLPTARAAAEDVPQGEKALVLRELEVMVGDETGDLQLARPVTRAEFTKLLIALSPQGDTIGGQAATSPYPDVSYRAWYAPYVRAAVEAGLVQGDLAGYFHPDRTITLGEGATMAVRLLGYPDAEFAAHRWPAGQLALFRSLELTAGMTAREAGDVLSRADCLHLFYNLLTVPTRSGTPYITALGGRLNAEGEVDLRALLGGEPEGPVALSGTLDDILPYPAQDLVLFRDDDRAQPGDLWPLDLIYWYPDQPVVYAYSSSALAQLSAGVEGPVTAQAGWESRLPFAPAEAASVTRDGAKAAPADIQTGDLVYYSKYTRALYVYSRKVSGTVEAVTPSLASPTAVTVAGQVYPLETFSAQYAFSDLGTFRKGDAVTLSLGRGGGVAAVSPMAEDTWSQLGLVTALESRFYTDDHGNRYLADSVTVTATDGRSYTYPWSGDGIEVGDLVRLYRDDGRVALAPLATQKVTGTFNADATALGRLDLAPNAEILDTYGETGALSLPAGRLAGVTLTADMVRHCALDEDGAVTALILNNVSGDLHRYGILTDYQRVAAGYGVSFQSIYTCDFGGVAQPIAVQGKQFPVTQGPVALLTDGEDLKLAPLQKLENVVLSDRQAVAGSRRHTLADQVLYYLYNKKDDTYTLATRSQLTAGGYPLTAWYDVPDSQGGRVRIIVGRAD